MRWLLAVVRDLTGTIFRRRRERDFEAELKSHLAMHIDDNVRAGMDPTEARRVAHLKLGGVEQVKERWRDAHPLSWVGTFWLDIKLGVRMLRKSWGLTLTAGLAMTIAISIGAVVCAVLDLALGRTVPLEEGDRVVVVQTWDERAHLRHPTSLADFERWRDTLRSLEDVGAFQTSELILETPDGIPEPIHVARMTAAGFELARVQPLLGRWPADPGDDEVATPVAVIGHDVWQTRFFADPRVVGSTLRLSQTIYTIVGVMPAGFAFPVNHSVWIPLRFGASDPPLKPGPEGAVFGRLASGVTLEGAQSELEALGLLAESQADEELRPRVVPYTFAFTGDFDQAQVSWVVRLVLILVALLLVPPCANIAILVYARILARQDEFAARYALGAGRGRIVGQLFLEVLVLAVGSAGLALLLAGGVVSWVQSTLRREMGGNAPFWMEATLSMRTVLFVAGLAVLAALIAGLLPALKATGRRMQAGLRSLGSHSRMQLGPTWTVLVVGQVALSLAALPSAVEMGWGTARTGILGPGFAAEEYLTARLLVDSPAGLYGAPPERLPAARRARFAALQEELLRELEAEPGVVGVSVASAVPNEAPWVSIEFEQPAPSAGLPNAPSRQLVRTLSVDDAFFDVFDISLLTGRAFSAGDFDRGRAGVLVNRALVQELGADANPLGRRLRYVTAESASNPGGSETWYEIVGVVADQFGDTRKGTVYHPVAPGGIYPASLAVRVAPSAEGVADRLREMTAALDPAMRLEEVLFLDEIVRQHLVGDFMGVFGLLTVTFSVLLLSVAGMYALMSFTVNQRRREIGIRAALGARPRLLLAGIFKRAFAQLGSGALIGVVIALAIDYYLPVEQAGGWEIPGIVPAAAVFMLCIGLAAAAGPARRGLRVHPTEALKDG